MAGAVAEAGAAATAAPAAAAAAAEAATEPGSGGRAKLQPADIHADRRPIRPQPIGDLLTVVSSGQSCARRRRSQRRPSAATAFYGLYSACGPAATLASFAGRTESCSNGTPAAAAPPSLRLHRRNRIAQCTVQATVGSLWSGGSGGGGRHHCLVGDDVPIF